MRKPLVLFLIYRRLRDGNLEEVLTGEKPDTVETECLRDAAGYDKREFCGEIPIAIKQLLVANSHFEPELVA
jgi:hypothetical protein